jgi:hypothetical protein
MDSDLLNVFKTPSKVMKYENIMYIRTLIMYANIL